MIIYKKLILSAVIKKNTETFNNNNNNNKLHQASLRRWLTRKPSLVATCAKIEKQIMELQCKLQRRKHEVRDKYERLYRLMK